MRPFRFLLLASLMLAFASAGCDSLSATEDAGVVRLTGQVLDGSNEPVPEAVIRLSPLNTMYTTDGQGRFETSLAIDSTMQLTVSASKDGYSDNTVSLLAIAGDTLDTTLRLFATGEAPPESGRASNILLLSQSQESIGVKESGSPEVLDLTFQVADSMGRPVVLNHAVDVNFRLGASPGGGEFLFPSSARTDNNGKVDVHLSSGTKAGVVQVVAEATVDGHLLRSQPVGVTIHGGLPDAAHFTLAPSTHNFPGLTAYGLTDNISVIVGDKYGNPVKPGTAVYFTTTHGVIGGSTLTGEDGGGAVQLMSANPLPTDLVSQGVATVTARTADETQGSIVTRIPIVMSGSPWVYMKDLADEVATLDNTYEFYVADAFGNPLAEGTTVTVTAQGEKVKAVGNTNITVGKTGFYRGACTDCVFTYQDVIRPGFDTEYYRFRAVADTSASEGVSLEAITIKVSGPNGETELPIFPADAGKTGTRLPDSIVREVTPEGYIRFSRKQD